MYIQYRYAHQPSVELWKASTCPLWPCHHKLLLDSVPFEQAQQFTFMFLQMLRKTNKECHSMWHLGSFSLWHTHFLTFFWGKSSGNSHYWHATVSVQLHSLGNICSAWSWRLRWALPCLEEKNVDGFALKWSCFIKQLNEEAVGWVVTTQTENKPTHKCFRIMFSQLYNILTLYY